MNQVTFKTLPHHSVDIQGSISHSGLSHHSGDIQGFISSFMLHLTTWLQILGLYEYLFIYFLKPNIGADPEEVLSQFKLSCQFLQECDSLTEYCICTHYNFSDDWKDLHKFTEVTLINCFYQVCSTEYYIVFFFLNNFPLQLKIDEIL